MINKIYKNIHNKYSTLFIFIFFLRYLLGIFFISLVLLLLIPHFFDFKKKEEILKNHLSDRYGLKLNSYVSIKYNSLPIPNLEVKNADMSIDKDRLRMSTSSLNIYPKLTNIYNFKEFNSNKIIIDKNRIILEDSDLKILINYIYNLKNRLILKDLDLKVNRKNKSLINFNNIYFSNYGYNKNIVTGKLYNKKFKIIISDNYDKINFKLLNTGLTADINIYEIKKNSLISGVFKSKFLNSNLKFNFNYGDKKLEIYNAYFRNKDLSFSNKSTIIYKPFFYLSSFSKLEDINIKSLKKLNLNKIFASKDFIKKINAKNKVNFKSKKFGKNLIDDFILNIDLAYGRLEYSKKIFISDNYFNCQGDINLLEEYPILYFKCSIISDDKKELLRKFAIKYKNKNEKFNFNVAGNINILNNKINFNSIEMNKNYKASKEDLNYFKITFERVLFDKDFKDIFNLKKIKDFILEIS